MSDYNEYRDKKEPLVDHKQISEMLGYPITVATLRQYVVTRNFPHPYGRDENGMPSERWVKSEVWKWIKEDPRPPKPKKSKKGPVKMKQNHEDLRSGHWIMAAEGKLRDRGVWPNKIYYTQEGKKVIILLRRSPTNAFSFSVANINDFGNHPNVDVRVRLTEPDGSFIDEAPIARVMKAVAGEMPMSSKFAGWGDFFWITDKFEISRPGEYATPSSKEEVSALDYIMGRRTKK